MFPQKSCWIFQHHNRHSPIGIKFSDENNVYELESELAPVLEIYRRRNRSNAEYRRNLLTYDTIDGGFDTDIDIQMTINIIEQTPSW